MVAAVKHLNALPRPLRFFAEPFENLIAGSSLVTGVPAAAGSVRPQSLVVAVQPIPWLLHVWGVLLCVGGVALLVARWRIARPQTELGSQRRASVELLRN